MIQSRASCRDIYKTLSLVVVRASYILDVIGIWLPPFCTLSTSDPKALDILLRIASVHRNIWPLLLSLLCNLCPAFWLRVDLPRDLSSHLASLQVVLHWRRSLLDFHSEDDFLNGAMLAVQLASIHRPRWPAPKVTCPLRKELAKKSGFILLKRLSERVGFLNRLPRTMTILLLLQILLFQLQVKR